MHPSNRGKGRPRGSPNKRTNQSVTAFFASKGTTPVEMVWELLPDLDPSEQARTLMKLQEYMEPKAIVPVVRDEDTDAQLQAVPTGNLVTLIKDANNA